MKLLDIHGNVMMEISSLKCKDDVLVMKGKLMGTMPATININPEQLWEAKDLLSWSVIRHVPSMVIKGRRQSKEKQKLKLTK